MTRPLSSIKSAQDLVDAGLIAKSQRQAIEEVSNKYTISIPQTIAARIDRSDPHDPLARQFVPSVLELHHQPYEHDDPIGDNLKSPLAGIVHRYPDRALLKLVNVCPVYCRFCFRRESVGPQTSKNVSAHSSGILSDQQLQKAIEYLQSHDEIWEVILTGGDPLVLSPRRIKALNDALAGIAHIKIIRWHTRVPIVMPEHITEDLCQALKCQGKTVYIGLHTNHPRELNEEAINACARLIDAGHTLISQTVLLKGVNDNAKIMIALMRRLTENRIKPYYLHHPDLAKGTGHFRVEIEKGQDIVRQMRAELSGIAQPLYVLDIPGAHGKVPIGPSYLPRDTLLTQNTQLERAYTVLDARGHKHAYVDVANNVLKKG